MNTEILKRLDDAISSTLIGNSKDLDCNVGAAICIIKDGKEVYRNEYGEADKENHIPMEKGVIALSDPVSNFIPSFTNQTVLTEKGYVPAKREVVIQDLLNMTAGLTYPDASFPAGKEMQNMIDKYYADVEAGNPISTYDLAVLIGEQPLEFQPGEGWRYRFCADVLGAVIEVVTGKTYGEYLKETIFEPLGMTETDFYVPIEKQNRFMQNYQYMPETQTMEPCTWQHLGLTYMHKKKPLFESGGAGLVSTIDDYSKFVNMMLGKGTLGNVRILGRKMYDWDTIKGYGYGNLMRVMMDVPASHSFGSEGEFGWDGWLGSYVAMDPKENLAIIYVIQKCGGNGYRDIQVIRDIVYSAL